jgi:hypothetical protein
MKNQAILYFLFSFVLSGVACSQWVKSSSASGASIRAFGTKLIAANSDGFYLTTDSGGTWTQVNPGFKRVTSLAVVGSRAFVANEYGVYRSTDDGANWSAVYDNATTIYLVSALGISGANLLIGKWYGQIIRSSDSGATWNNVGSIGYGNSVKMFHVSGTDLYVGGVPKQYADVRGGLFRSTDNGATWVSAGLLGSSVYSLASNTTYLFAGSDSNVFRSSNKGSDWTKIGSGLPTCWRITALAVNGTNLFAGTNGGGVFLSTDDGTMWNPVNTGLANLNVKALLVSQPKIIAGTDDGVFRSTNNGTTWTEVPCGVDPSVTAFTTNGSSFYAGTNGLGVFRSTDHGAHWILVDNGLPNQVPNEICACGSNLFAGVSDGGVFRSSNDGTNWKPMNNGLTRTDVKHLAAFGSNVYVGSYELVDGDELSWVFRSPNNGVDWTLIKTNYHSQVMCLSANEMYVFLSYGGYAIGNFQRATVEGSSWTTVVSGLPLNPAFYALASSGATLFASPLEVLGSSAKPKGAYYSTNSGDTWVQAGFADSAVYGYAFWGTHVFAIHNNIVFMTADSGKNWSPLNSGPTGVVSRNDGIQVLGDYLFVATTSDGIWRLKLTDMPVPITLRSFSAAPMSQDGHVLIEWMTESEVNNYGFWVEKDTSRISQSFCAIPGSFTAGHGTSQLPQSYSYVDGNAMPGKWVYRLRQIDLDGTIHFSEGKTVDISTTAVAGELEVPTVITLAQNYPNPFNPSTTIRYGLPNRGHVLISVFDMMGRQVAVLEEGEREAGYHEVRFEGKNLASGMYIYRMVAGKSTEVRKLLIVK